jgi:hypothetical protein
MQISSGGNGPAFKTLKKSINAKAAIVKPKRIFIFMFFLLILKNVMSIPLEGYESVGVNSVDPSLRWSVFPFLDLDHQ